MFANFDIFENGRVCSQTHMYVICITLKFKCMYACIFMMCVCLWVCMSLDVCVCLCVCVSVFVHIHDYMVYAARTCKGWLKESSNYWKPIWSWAHITPGPWGSAPRGDRPAWNRENSAPHPHSSPQPIPQTIQYIDTSYLEAKIFNTLTYSNISACWTNLYLFILI